MTENLLRFIGWRRYRQGLEREGPLWKFGSAHYSIPIRLHRARSWEKDFFRAFLLGPGNSNLTCQRHKIGKLRSGIRDVLCTVRSASTEASPRSCTSKSGPTTSICSRQIFRERKEAWTSRPPRYHLLVSWWYRIDKQIGMLESSYSVCKNALLAIVQAPCMKSRREVIWASTTCKLLNQPH